MEVDSKQLEYGPGTICAVFSFFSRLWGWGSVLFQLSGWYWVLKRGGGPRGRRKLPTPLDRFHKLLLMIHILHDQSSI